MALAVNSRKCSVQYTEYYRNRSIFVSEISMENAVNKFVFINECTFSRAKFFSIYSFQATFKIS